MYPLLPDSDPRSRRTPVRDAAWLINGKTYAHSAARFWTTLLDEAHDTLPDHTSLELSTVSALVIDRDHLDPSASLVRMFQSPPPTSSFETLVKELEWTGPPAGIRIVLYRGKDVCRDGNLSIEYADAETFLYLTAWLLEWAQIPAFQWTAERMHGEFRAEDRLRGRIYLVGFTLHTDTLAEEMLKYTLMMQCRRESD